MDLTTIERMVDGGYMIYPPDSITHSPIVSRDSVRIVFVIVALNIFDILSEDIGIEYLNARCCEKVYFTAGDEFGNWKDDNTIVVCAMYGLKSSGSS